MNDCCDNLWEMVGIEGNKDKFVELQDELFQDKLFQAGCLDHGRLNRGLWGLYHSLLWHRGVVAGILSEEPKPLPCPPTTGPSQTAYCVNKGESDE